MESSPTPAQLTGDEKVVILFTAQNAENKPFHAYIKLTLKKLGEFQTAQIKGTAIDLNQLGEVLETGWGHHPEREVHERIVAEHGEVLDAQE